MINMDLNLKNNKASVICPQCSQKLKFFYNGHTIIEKECFDCHYRFRLMPEEAQDEVTKLRLKNNIFTN